MTATIHTFVLLVVVLAAVAVVARRVGTAPSNEGEGLVDDATALVLYRFAIAAILTAAFTAPVSEQDLNHVRLGVGEGRFRPRSQPEDAESRSEANRPAASAAALAWRLT